MLISRLSLVSTFHIEGRSLCSQSKPPDCIRSLGCPTRLGLFLSFFREDIFGLVVLRSVLSPYLSIYVD